MNSAQLTSVTTGWLDTEHRPVGPAPSLPSLEPPMKGRRGEPEQPSCFSLAVQLLVEDALHPLIMPDSL